MDLDHDTIVEKLRRTSGVRESIMEYFRLRSERRKAAAAKAEAAGVPAAQIATLLDEPDPQKAEEIADAIIQGP